MSPAEVVINPTEMESTMKNVQHAKTTGTKRTKTTRAKQRAELAKDVAAGLITKRTKAERAALDAGTATPVTARVVRSALLGRPGLDRSESTLSAEQYADVKRLALENADIVACRDWKEREDVAFGAKATDYYRVGSDHTPADMLRLTVAPDAVMGDALSDGIAGAADDLLAFVGWIADGGGAESDSEIIQRVGDGIQNRLRVLAEMARRMRDAVNPDTSGAKVSA